MEETWKEIESGRHRVSDKGNMMRLDGKNFTPQVTRKGYHQISIYGVGSKLIHRLVAIAFIPNPLNLPQINHKNGIKTDNRVENLEWCDQSKNMSHAYSTGLKKKMIGNKNPRSKNPLSEEDIKLIRFLLKNDMPARQIGAEFGVSRNVIFGIKYKRSWTHV